MTRDDEPSELAWIAARRSRAAWLRRSVRRLSKGANLHDIRVCDVLSGDEQNGQIGEGWTCVFMRHPPRKRRAARRSETLCYTTLNVSLNDSKRCHSYPCRKASLIIYLQTLSSQTMMTPFGILVLFIWLSVVKWLIELFPSLKMMKDVGIENNKRTLNLKISILTMPVNSKRYYATLLQLGGG